MGIYGWLRICFFNLLLVAALGILLRYKIAFSLPLVLQKNVLHSHSHFAFNGWITQCLMVLMLQYLSRQHLADTFSKYKPILLLNLLTSYGMLVSFILQGYALASISFSTLSIFTSYIFAYMYWKDLNRVAGNGQSHWWFKAALVFNILSSFGAFSLAIIMANKIGDQKIVLSAIYYFLHFQYNGWFFFACMGLFFSKIKLTDHRLSRRIFWLFALACVPAYFLSILWSALDPLLYWVIVLASLAQTVAWILFLTLLHHNRAVLRTVFTKNAGWLLLLSLTACTIKIALQQFSVIPFLSTLAFGFRPIVIGYLHLVLLGVITLFLVGYIVSTRLIAAGKITMYGIVIFVAGIFLNELLLMTQGVGAISDVMIPNLNIALFIVALIMFSGLLVLNLSLRKRSDPASDSLAESNGGRSTLPQVGV
jgi:hypothetical protein